MTILSEIAAYTLKRVEKAKELRPADQLRAEAYALPKGSFSFEKALKKPSLSFICECKKASPSKGIIAPDFPYLDIALSYEKAGAEAISVLTEPKWFLGRDEYLKEIVSHVNIPVLRKDFTVDAYMIYEAKLLGASAVLLIVSLLRQEELKEYLRICDELGLSALVECHDEKEIGTALSAGARVIGVNNRNLKDFSIDRELGRRLRQYVPKEAVYVSESGVKGASDLKGLTEIGADAVLIGETLMRAGDRETLLKEWRDSL
ncbi:MAG: indole-3-glycerol phosphate synthase TrpC [Lachnospiraceae bacterium]|nr:indole-3-glycerol phosphate synthase TrpC [Lachnospiraceae bacterium]